MLDSSSTVNASYPSGGELDTTKEKVYINQYYPFPFGAR